MSIAHERGRRAERAAAKRCGGVRVGNRGIATADVEVGDWGIVEVKERARKTQWIEHALLQVEGAATAYVTPRVPWVRVHHLGERYDRDWIIMRALEFEALHGQWRGAAQED